MDIWDAAEAGDLGEVQRLVGDDPGLLNAKDPLTYTPLMHASREGHVGVVRWLVDQGAALDERHRDGYTALGLASSGGHTPVVRLLLEGGGDPTIADDNGQTPLIDASEGGHLEIVRCLLDHPSAAVTINQSGALRHWRGPA
jgi:ankyrin repeat protein